MITRTLVRILLVILIAGGINFSIPFISIELFQKYTDSTFFLILQLIGIIFVDLTMLHYLLLINSDSPRPIWMLLLSVPMLSAMLFIIALFFVNTG